MQRTRISGRNVLILAALNDMLMREFDVESPDESDVMQVTYAGLTKHYDFEDEQQFSDAVKKDLEALQAEFLVRVKADVGV